ncbi:TIGR02594 family protein [Hyphomicrobium sp. 99]|uniref:TIGR02594 family protein n=1 Tax=Hyphomicrobium sp. 99 TaxID=1163419 RepID=UPI0005F7C39A|nr:TIGR02594 family protein [Hyphomicrobium sp. 99]
MDQPAWLAAAWAEFGVREIPGKENAAEILRYFREAGDSSVESEETPWCAAFAGAMLKRAGCEGTGSLLARSYLDWGISLDEPRFGAVAVLARGDDPTAGHVGFVIGATGEKLYLLGGNQSDAVTVAPFDAARLLGFRWPHADADTEHATASNGVFAKLLAHVLEMEGGYSNDPYDPGGPTNRGVTLEVYANFKGQTIDAGSRPRLISELKSIPDPVVEAIYRRRYYDPAQCALFTAPLALMHFDAAVNHGVGAAIRMLQQVVNVTVDGEIGSETLSAIGGRSLIDLIDDYAEIRRTRYRALPHFWRFGRGWLKRVDATLALGKSWAAAEGTTRGLLEPTQIAKGESNMGNQATTTKTTDDGTKWWVQSKTLWGTLITAAATVIPVVAPAIGVSLPADVIQAFGDQVLTALQALTAVFGTALAIYGRFKASSVLSLRKS